MNPVCAIQSFNNSIHDTFSSQLFAVITTFSLLTSVLKTEKVFLFSCEFPK